MRKQRNSHIYHFICERCNKEFESLSPRAKACPECRDIIQRERSLERWKKNGRKQPSAKNWRRNSETGKLEYVKSGYNQKGTNNNAYKNGTGIDWYIEAIKILPEICNRCGVTNSEINNPKETRNLCLHHIDHNHFNNDPNNWEILCKACHQNHHTKRDEKTGRFIKQKI